MTTRVSCAVALVITVSMGLACAGEPSAAPNAEQQTAQQQQLLATEPALAIAPFDAQQARRHQEEWAAYLGVPVEVTNSIGMKLVLIPPGEFMMGSVESVEDIARCLKMKSTAPLRDEYPLHRVRLIQPYYLSVHELTQFQYEQLFPWHPIMGPRHGAGPSHPVVMVGWQRAVECCGKLSALPEEKAAGRVYRLPTEAEWEHACRAGSTTRYSYGDDADDLKDYACFDGNSDRVATPSWTKIGQCLGPFRHARECVGMVRRSVGDSLLFAVTSRQSYGAASGSFRVIRGGSWADPPEECLSSSRDWGSLGAVFNSIGFRVALDVPEKTGQSTEGK